MTQITKIGDAQMAKLNSPQLPEIPTFMDGPPRVRLWGDFEGPYVVESSETDGTLVIVPDEAALEEIERLRLAGRRLAGFEAIYLGLKPVPWEDLG